MTVGPLAAEFEGYPLHRVDSVTDGDMAEIDHEEPVPGRLPGDFAPLQGRLIAATARDWPPASDRQLRSVVKRLKPFAGYLRRIVV